MNVVVWLLQGGLALVLLAGGAYKLLKPSDLATTIPTLSTTGWQLFGLIEVAGALLLVVPAWLGRGQTHTSLVATVLAVESLVLAALYARQSGVLSAENPLVWAIGLGLAATLVAWLRKGAT